MESDEIAFVDPELNSNDDDPDGDKEPDGDMDPGTSVVITTSRSVIIEPVLAMFSASFLSCNTLISQLVYTIVAYQNNFTLILNTHGEPNGTNTCAASTSGDHDFNLEAYVQSESAKLLTCLSVCSQVPAMILVIVYGAYSDRIGRKLPIVMPLLGQFVKCSVYMVTVRYRLSIYLLMAANVVEGLSGGFPTMIMSCYAYLTQICRNDKLTTRLTAIDATCGLCGAICQVIMGLAISHIGYMWPFIMVIGLHLVNFIYVLLFVPELKKEVKHDRHYVPVTKQLMRGLELYVSSDDYGAVWQRWLLLVAMLCCNTVVIARWGPLTLYCMKYPLCWSSVLIGIYVAFTSICSNAGEIGLVATLHRRLHDVGLAIIGCISGILYFVLLAFCKTTWSMFLVTPVGSGSFLPTAMLRVMNSKLTPGDRQGAMYSILSLLDITCELTGSVVFNLIYGATQLIMATLVFFVMSGLEFLGMAIIIIYFLKSGKGRQQEVFTRETTRTEYEPIT